MALIATEAKSLSNVVKQELWADAGYCRAVLTAAVATVPGTVLENGTGYAVAMAKAAAGADVLALVKGPAIVSKGGLILGALDQAEVVAALEAAGIAVNDTI